MIFDLGVCLLLFFGIVLGLGWPVARRLPLSALEKVGASAALSLLLVFLVGWATYVWTLSLKIHWVVPALAFIGIIAEWRTIRSALRDDDTRRLLIGQILISVWSVGLLALTLTYSGGNWVADWWGHWQRTWFFLDQGPRDIVFNGFDPLTSRPPLANVVTGVFVQITRRDFVHYQLFSTFFASLSFFPAGMLAHRWGGKSLPFILALLFIASPMFAENVTYSWTKLPAAFFVLLAVYFFLRAHDQDSPRAAALLFAVTLATGLLTHYSAGPYAVVLGISWIALGWRHWKNPLWLRSTLWAIAAGAGVLAVWFGWCFSAYGIGGSLLTNSSITDKAPDAVSQLHTVVLNIRDTLVPHFLRHVEVQPIQTSSIGKWRDWFFQLYQVNFMFVFGSVAGLAIAFKLVRLARNTSKPRRIFWMAFIVGNILLGIGVHGARESGGLAHICLQPLVLIGLAFLAAQWKQLSHLWRSILIVGAIFDFAAGIGLQFAAESFAFERWFTPNRSVFEIVADYSQPTSMNFYAKMHNHWAFLGDQLADYGYAIVGLLALIILSIFKMTNASNGISTPQGE